ncbi:hypothetical protein GO308_09685 [Sphingomonas sp. SFZ2018-12]|uniref:phage tail tube protein n=1 Tax=Sphingomonas sp. SFZ2018-12 TaxID=2683197 RepID=UPI001F0D7DD9|nr:phage tail tube protein [Sphingomonas sp. SFZ2018-12]MCH4893379.1 hypothetical protein [Sphingomonas sp. SFZ2018-12]
MVDATKVVLAKKEVTYGTDSVPTAAANAILTRNYSAKPIELDRVERNLDTRIYGAEATVPGAKRQTLAYEVEIAGSGAAGTAPAWMELLEGCGMTAAVLAAGESATQGFALPGVEPTSLTHHHYMSDQRRRTIGSVGTFTMDFTAGAYPFIGFNWIGLLPVATPFDKSAPAAVNLARWRQPVEVSTEQTEMTLDGYVPIFRSFNLDAAVTTAFRNLVGRRYVRRGGHAISATAVVEAPDIAVKDYLQRLSSGDLVTFDLTHGTVAGNIIELAAPKVQITDITESEEDEILMWTIQMAFTVDGGSPDLTIIAK